jgi:hypothetical protein
MNRFPLLPCCASRAHVLYPRRTPTSPLAVTLTAPGTPRLQIPFTHSKHFPPPPTSWPSPRNAHSRWHPRSALPAHALGLFHPCASLCRTVRKGTQLMWQRASLNPFRRSTRFHALQLAKTVYRITMWRAHNNIAFQYTTNEKKCSLLPTYRSGIAADARVCTFYHSEFSLPLSAVYVLLLSFAFKTPSCIAAQHAKCIEENARAHRAKTTSAPRNVPQHIADFARRLASTK